MTTRHAPRAGHACAGKLPLTELAAMKRSGEPIVMVTAYDAPERAGSRTRPASTSCWSATRRR